MSTYTQIIYQIVFSTQKREPILHHENRPALFKYISGIIKNQKSHLYRINGVEDHLHIVTHLHPTVALSDFVKDIKVASSIKIKKPAGLKISRPGKRGMGALLIQLKRKTS